MTQKGGTETVNFRRKNLTATLSELSAVKENLQALHPASLHAYISVTEASSVNSGGKTFEFT